MKYTLTGNPFVDTGILTILAHVSAKNDVVILDELTPEILTEAMGEGEEFGKWLAKTNRQLNAFFMVVGTNSALVNPSNNKKMIKTKQYGILDDEDTGWKSYIETLKKLYEELINSNEEDSISQPFCESCGDRPATQVLDSVGRDFFPLAGSLGNDAQALPAASRAPRVCGLCLIAIQWLPLGAMVFNGKLGCFQFTEPKLSQYLVNEVYQENKSILGVTTVEKKASFGAGKGATPATMLLLKILRKLHKNIKGDNLSSGTSLNIWAFSNSGQNPDCEVIEINNPALQFLWNVAIENKLSSELDEVLRRENPKNPSSHLLTAIENKTDYFGFYPFFNKKGEKQSTAASPKLYEIFQTQVLNRKKTALDAAKRLAGLLYKEFKTNEDVETPDEKKKKLFEQILKENPRRSKDRQIRTELRKQMAMFAEEGMLTLDDYVQLFSATNLEGIVNLNSEMAQKIWREKGAAVRSSNYGWDLVWFYLHHLNDKQIIFEESEQIKLNREELIMFTNPKIQEFAKDVFEATLDQRGGEDIKRGLDFVKKNIVDGFSRDKINLRKVRDWWAGLAEKELAETEENEKYNNLEWDFMCRNEHGQNEIGEMLFQFRLEIANLYSRRLSTVQK